MSPVHIITLFLVISLVGDAVTIHAFYPVLRIANERPVSRILAWGFVLARLWIDVYFISVLLSYYGHVRFDPHYSELLAGLSAVIAWLVVIWFLVWRHGADD